MWFLKISSFWRRFPVTERRARHHPTTSSSLRASSEGVSSRFPDGDFHGEPCCPPKKLWQQNETNMETNTSNIVTIVLTCIEMYWMILNLLMMVLVPIMSNWSSPKLGGRRTRKGCSFFFLWLSPSAMNAKATSHALGSLLVDWFKIPRLVVVSKWEGSLILLNWFSVDMITEYVLTQICVNHFGSWCSDAAKALGNSWKLISFWTWRPSQETWMLCDNRGGSRSFERDQWIKA